MNLSVHQLRLRNFVTFADQDIPLHAQGLVLLKGKNLDEPWRGRNAAGKTLIGDALLWLLQGETSRDITVDSVIGKNGRHCSVEAEIEIGKARITVGRYRKHPDHGTSFKIFSGEGDVSHRRMDDTKDRLDSVIGCSANLIRISCFQYGDESKYFSRMKTDERAKIIDEIVGASEANIPARYKTVNTEIRALESELMRLESEKITLQSLINGD
ncbi:MAG TPA: ATP-binding protein, partial [Cyclobacteriaceae bacterium]|nr:ATP-binding protein [Cyclobacteriaceae bacterium]